MDEDEVLEPSGGGWTLQITKHDGRYVAHSGGRSAKGSTPGEAVNNLYEALF